MDAKKVSLAKARSEAREKKDHFTFLHCWLLSDRFSQLIELTKMYHGNSQLQQPLQFIRPTPGPVLPAFECDLLQAVRFEKEYLAKMRKKEEDHDPSGTS